MTALHVIKGLPEDLPTELGRRKTLHEDERRKVNQRNEQAGQVFERTHFEQGRFFQQEAERLLGKDLGGKPAEEDACWKETVPPEKGWYVASPLKVMTVAHYWNGEGWSWPVVYEDRISGYFASAKTFSFPSSMPWLRKLRDDELPAGVTH